MATAGLALRRTAVWHPGSLTILEVGLRAAAAESTIHYIRSESLAINSFRFAEGGRVVIDPADFTARVRRFYPNFLLLGFIRGP
jgi:hypothetical protein